MSMPSFSLRCNRCDLSAGSMMLWGSFLYRLDGEEFPLNRKLGWCDHCHKIGAMEDFTVHAEVLEKLQVRKAELARCSTSGWSRLWRALLPACRARNKQLATEVREAENLLALINRRQGVERCLNCGSDKVRPIEPQEKPSYDESSEEWLASTGFNHPYCGGEVIAAANSMRFAVRPKICVYSTKPHLIEENLG